MKRIRGAVTMEREYHRLVRMVEKLAADPKHDPAIVANARKAIADYEALPAHLR